MCLMHKNDPYGKVLLKQSDKQSDKQIINFASKFARLLPYQFDTIVASLEELLREKVVYFEGDFLCQKRMIEDNELSLTRSKSGSKGGKKTQEKIKKVAKAKNKANSEIEYENEITVLGSKNTVEAMEVKKSQFPKPEDFNGLPEIKIGSAIQLISTTARVQISTDDVNGLWNVFKDQNLTGKKFYQDEGAVYSHFLNWIRTQPFKNNPSKTTYEDAVTKARKNFKPIKE